MRESPGDVLLSNDCRSWQLSPRCLITCSRLLPLASGGGSMMAAIKSVNVLEPFHSEIYRLCFKRWPALLDHLHWQGSCGVAPATVELPVPTVSLTTELEPTLFLGVRLWRLIVLLFFTRTRWRLMARPKQWIAIGIESRSSKRVKTSQNERSEPDSTGTSSHEGEDLSMETSAPGGLPETWLEDVLQSGEEVTNTVSAETMPLSPQEEEDCVVLKSVAGIKTEGLPNKVTMAGSVQGPDDRQVESVPAPAPAPAPRGVSFTGGQTGSDSIAAARGFNCTTCGKLFNCAWDILEHPNLGVGICRDCRSFLFSSPYTKDRVDGYEEQCRWCGEGGKIVMCDDCDKVFCQACIVRNFGPKDLAEIVRSIHWSCFSCNPDRLQCHIKEFKEFKKSTASAGRPPAWQRGAPWAGKSRTNRDPNYIPGRAAGEGATIADLLAQEEERRKQNPGMWVKPRGKPGRKPSRAPQVPGGRKMSGTVQDALNAKRPLSADRPKFRHPTEVNRRATNSNATIADIVQQATLPPVLAAKTYIRPHQWEEKRRQAAERRKRAEEAAEAERVKNVTDFPNVAPKNNHENFSRTQAKADSRFPHTDRNEEKEFHFRHPGEDTGKLSNGNGMAQVKSEYLPTDPDVAELAHEDKSAKPVFFSEGSNGELMPTSEDVFSHITKNLFANFTGVSNR